jgi:hypothetical protein
MIRNRHYRDFAVFTIAQEEPEFIHPWVNHYKRHVADPGDIHVLVHAPTYPGGEPSPSSAAWDKALMLTREHHRVVTLPVHHAAAFDHQWLGKTVARFQSFLLQSYDWVLFAEIDEFIVPTPHPAMPQTTLLKFVQNIGQDHPSAVQAAGFEIVQQDDEPPLAPALYADGSNAELSIRDLLVDRRWWYPSQLYSKALLANAPMQWSVGFHHVEDIARDISIAQPARGLTLLHLHRLDFDLAMGRLRRSRARRWSQTDIDGGLGWQNRVEDEKFRVFWKMHSDTGKPFEAGQLTLIPPDVRGALGRSGA